MINAGYAPNAITEEGSVKGTIRTADIGVWRMMEGLLAELVPQVLAPTGCTYELIHHKGVPPVLNDDVATAVIADAARTINPSTVVEARSLQAVKTSRGTSSMFQVQWPV